MGLDVSVQIFNQTHSKILDIFSVSGDERLLSSPFKRKEEYTVPAMEPNTTQLFQVKPGAINPVVFLLILSSKFTAPLGLDAIQAIIRAIEKPLELVLQYEDGTVDDVSFSLRPINVRQMTYESKDTVANMFNLDLGNLLKCLLFAPVMAQTAGSDIDFVFLSDTDAARELDQDCRVCLMRLDKERLDHTWTVRSAARIDMVYMTFQDTKSNLSHNLAQEMTNKAKLRMQKKRFKECMQQLLSALATALSTVLQETTIEMMKATIHTSADFEMELALKEEKESKDGLTNNLHYLNAKRGFEAVKILATTKQEKQQMQESMEAIDLKNKGDEFFREAYEAEMVGNDSTKDAMKTNEPLKHMQAADQAKITKDLYDKAAKCYQKAIKKDARLGYLEAVTMDNITKQEERERNHLGRAGLRSTPDLKADVRTHRLPWQGKTLLEIQGQREK